VMDLDPDVGDGCLLAPGVEPCGPGDGPGQVHCTEQEIDGCLLPSIGSKEYIMLYVR
jgi:hypothetical protein